MDSSAIWLSEALVMSLAADIPAATTTMRGSYGDNRQLITLDSETTGCLDGTPYKFYIWPGNSSDWSVNIQGGGWCLDEELCQNRAQISARGSSKNWNISGAWGPTDQNINGGPAAYTCEGLGSNCTRVYMPYCDGSCFSSSRAAPWPVNGTNYSLTFRGQGNLDRTIDTLQADFGFAKAKRLVISGGSAGGLSTYLKVDHFADRLRAAQAADADAEAAEAENEATAALPPSPGPRVVGRPVAGFFIDGPSFDPTLPTFAEQVKYGVAMFNATPPLSTKCKTNYVGEEWKCWMAPYAAPFVREPVFAVQSRFDEFQLQNLLGLPCFHGQTYAPPYSNISAQCNTSEKAAIVRFGADLLEQMQPWLQRKPESGAWLVSCIQHDVNVPAAEFHNITETQAFTSWLNGESLGKEKGYRFFDDCGASNDGTTPCAVGPTCAPPHF